jgi:FKBP-type peptidyl-prolyl cis-trans isomerase SlpA
MTEPQGIAAGDRVELHYRVLLADDTEIENSGEQAVTLIVGSTDLPEVVAQALIGKNAGERFRIEISGSDEVFGAYDSQNTQVIAWEKFTEQVQPELGALVEFTLPDGESIAGHVIGISDDGVSVDFNHPLVGRDCIYEIKIVEVGQGRVKPESRSLDNV